MKKLIISGLFSLIGIISFGQVNPNSTQVKGYQKSNGTYVQPHIRTNPNNTINDNYNTKPNVNPYNGKVGTVNPNNTYSQPKNTQPKKYY